ncbi:MAG: twin-arginine translocase TatA/TatE family subunit [Bacteroidetes bacterium]|nr:MAG: twin-arginine translocase TatA/TatE family subunit [Bacteroidota bacterium]
MNNFLLFFNISGGEIFIIVLAIYLILGPRKIPELARKLGKTVNEFRRATNDIRKEITRETGDLKKDLNVDLDINLENPIKSGFKTKNTGTGQPNPTPGKD